MAQQVLAPEAQCHAWELSSVLQTLVLEKTLQTLQIVLSTFGVLWHMCITADHMEEE
jgi:pyrroloquinoline quinone (PQQ) biosynthesis protein C